MKDFPPELIYVLIFIGIYLIQSLMKRRASQVPQESPQDDVPPQPRDAIPPDFAGLEQFEPNEWSTRRASIDEPVRAEAPAAVRARPRRRFARQSLMATQRDVQNAVVIATILGPCRALEPPGEAAVPTSPRRATR